MDTTEASKTTSTPSVLLNQPIIIDQGTFSIKAGFAGSSKPKAMITNRVGKVKHNRVMPGGALDTASTSNATSSTKSITPTPTTPSSNNNNLYIGNVLDEHSGMFQYEYNMHQGRIQNYTNMEYTWEYLYKDVLGNVKYEDHPVLFTEAPHTSMKDRTKLLETWFESYHCPAIYTTPCGILSLYASGRTTGLVLDVGHGVSSVIPVYEGFALQHSIVQSDIGGYDVVNYLQSLLRIQHGICLDRTSAEWEIVRKMKEHVGIVNLPNSKDKDTKDMNYKLPDGQVVHLSSKQRTEAPEVLFKPFQYLGSEQKSIIDCITTSIQKSDIDLRSTMYNTILLSGGSTLFPNFGNRILHELRSLTSDTNNVAIVPPSNRICVYAPQDRIVSSFIGGSILGSLSTFKYLWISKEEWEECGSANCNELVSKFQTVGI